MINKHVNDTLETAGTNLSFAENELTRPSEAAVGYSVCHMANNAMREYLISLLLYNYSLEFDKDELIQKALGKLKSWSIISLVHSAIKLDPRFEKLNISEISCAGIDGGNASETYCLSIDKVRKCSEIARESADLVNEYISNTKHHKDNTQIQILMLLDLN